MSEEHKSDYSLIILSIINYIQAEINQLLNINYDTV